jgi:hypothetical protein
MKAVTERTNHQEQSRAIANNVSQHKRKGKGDRPGKSLKERIIKSKAGRLPTMCLNTKEKEKKEKGTGQERKRGQARKISRAKQGDCQQCVSTQKKRKRRKRGQARKGKGDRPGKSPHGGHRQTIEL